MTEGALYRVNPESGIAESVDEQVYTNGYDPDFKKDNKELALNIWHGKACVDYRRTRLGSSMCGGGGYPGGYLGSRGIKLKQHEPNMRFHLGLKHGPTGEKYIACLRSQKHLMVSLRPYSEYS